MVLCPSCGEENPAKFRLCGYCGTPLAHDAADAPAAPAPAPVAETRLPPREIRKTVTLLFTDLKDSTALTGSIDAEAMNEIKARYFSAMGAEIRRHGGEVEKNIGDAIMAVFGRIRAREDDALRAVRAAHGMRQVLADLNDEFQRFYGVQITNRTGVNTGEIVANLDPDADQNLATGDAVNVAARLEQNAPAGEVLLGEVTHQLVQHHVEVERLELALKGKPDPVPAYHLLDVHEIAAPSHADTPLLGRDPEVLQLRQAYAETIAERTPRLVTVTGDAGVGKSRLISDFVAGVSAEAEVLHGRCLAYGDGITFWPLVEIVRNAAGILEDDSPDAARERIAALLPDDDPDREGVVDRVVSAMGLSARDFPVTEIFWGARRLLESVGGGPARRGRGRRHPRRRGDVPRPAHAPRRVAHTATDPGPLLGAARGRGDARRLVGGDRDARGSSCNPSARRRWSRSSTSSSAMPASPRRPGSGWSARPRATRCTSSSWCRCCATARPTRVTTSSYPPRSRRC